MLAAQQFAFVLPPIGSRVVLRFVQADGARSGKTPLS